MGPIVKCLNPVVDFGLVKVNSKETFELTVENQSPIQAEVLIKNSENCRLNFDSMLTMEQARHMDDFDITMAPLVFNKPFQTKNKNVIKLDHYGIQLKPFEKQIF